MLRTCLHLDSFWVIVALGRELIVNTNSLDLHSSAFPRFAHNWHTVVPCTRSSGKDLPYFYSFLCLPDPSPNARLQLLAGAQLSNRRKPTFECHCFLMSRCNIGVDVIRNVHIDDDIYTWDAEDFLWVLLEGKFPSCSKCQEICSTQFPSHSLPLSHLTWSLDHSVFLAAVPLPQRMASPNI